MPIWSPPEWEPLPEPLQPLRNFAAYVLREMGLVTADGGPTKQQIGILDWMEHGPDRQITVGFRGVAKSTMAAIYGAWRLRQDPWTEKLLVPSNTEEKAKEITTQMLGLFESIDILQCLIPDPKGRCSNHAFDVGPVQRGTEQAPSVRAVAILSSALTGKRCSCAIPDDIETLNNSITPTKQRRLLQAVTELEQIILPEQGQLLPRRIMFLGTPHIETSLYLELSRKRGYSIRYWPARYPNPGEMEQMACYDGNLDPLIEQEVLADPSLVGKPTDPERFGDAELLKREAGNTRATWQLNYMLNTRLSTADRFPIRLGDLIVMPLDGKALPETCSWGSGPDLAVKTLVCTGLGADRWYHRPAFLGDWIARKERWNCCMAVDPSGRGKDELAWAVVAELNGNLFLLESGGTQQGYSDESLQRLAEIAKRWLCTTLVVEGNYGGGIFTATLSKVLNEVHPCAVEEVVVTGQKERRMVDSLAPVIQQHRLVVAEHVIEADYLAAELDPETGHARSLAYQLSRLTTDRGCLEFDDKADALSIAVRWHVDALALNQRVQAQSRKDRLQEAVLQRYMMEPMRSADSMVLGIIPTAAGQASGGIHRKVIGGQGAAAPPSASR